ncbi:hypothetical protein Tco_0797381 [Tanacetum coccineum]
MTHPSGSGIGVEKPLSVEKITPTVTSEGTGDKPGVPDVTRRMTLLRDESQFLGARESDTESKMKNLYDDYQEEDKGMDDTTDQFDDDVYARLEEPTQTGKEIVQGKGADVEMDEAQQGNENLETTQEQVVNDAHLKKILLDKMEKSESYLTAPEHRDCYDGLKKSYALNKYFFFSLKSIHEDRGRKDKDKDEDPFARSDRGLKKRKLSKDAEPTIEPKKKDSTSGSSKGTKSQPKSSGKSVQSEEPVFEVAELDMPCDQEGNMGDNKDEPRKETASRHFSGYNLNGLKIENLTQGTRSNYAELEYEFKECYKALLEKLDWENPEGGDYPFDLSKPLPLITRVAKTQQRKSFYAYARGIQSRGDVYSTKRILAVTHVKVMRKHGYGYLEEIVVRRADNNRLINLLGDDVADFAIALRMFTRSLVIQKRVEDLQLGVESYQKKINVTKPDTTRPDLRKRHPYTPYKDPQGFIYVNDYKRNRLMRFNELYKFSDGTLTRLLSSLEDITKNIDMEYLPKRKWSNLEKKRAHFMIKDINKLQKERRMMRSLKKFVGEHAEYEESNTYVLERFITTTGNPVKKILLKLNLSDHRSILTDSKEYLKMVMERQSVKVKEIQERCIIKAFQDYQIKKGMSMSVQKSQVHEMAKFTRWRNEIMLG